MFFHRWFHPPNHTLLWLPFSTIFITLSTMCVCAYGISCQLKENNNNNDSSSSSSSKNKINPFSNTYNKFRDENNDHFIHMAVGTAVVSPFSLLLSLRSLSISIVQFVFAFLSSSSSSSSQSRLLFWSVVFGFSLYPIIIVD